MSEGPKDKFAFGSTEIYVFAFGKLETNCYILTNNGEIAVIDPSAQTDSEKEALLSFLNRLNGNLKFIINTHGHFDHIASNAVLKNKFPNAEIAIHRDDAEMLVSSEKNKSKNFGLDITSPKADILLEDGNTLEIGKENLKIIHIPGHTKGSTAVFGNGFIFTGDTLFAGTVGTAKDFKGAFNAMVDEIKNKLLTLPEETVILPGHGEDSTIGEEKRFNPFLQ